MKKTGVLWVILDLIFLVIFNVFFFLLGGVKHNASVWMSYGFIHFAYLMLLLTPRLIRKGKSMAVFGFSLYAVSSVYFLMELVAGVVFILVSPDSYTIALLVQLSIAGLYGVILIANIIANEHTAVAEEERQYQIAYVKDASARLEVLLGSVRDREARKWVEKVYDEIYSSPVKSHPDLAEIESRILQSIVKLEDTVATGNKDAIISLADSLLGAVNERNIRLRTLN